mgnify:FL=1
MCRLLFFAFILFAMPYVSYAVTDEGRISINAVVSDEGIPAEACRNLENKLTRALVANGYADNGYAERFVLTAKVDITSKDVVPTIPARVSQKMDVTFMVGDVIENKIYSSCTVSLAGIGTNETKAFIAAFSKVNPQQRDLQYMLIEAKAKIVEFYKNNSDEIVRNAQTLASMQKYDEAIFRLMSVPNVYAEGYKKCQDAAVTIYQQKIDNEAATLLAKAKNVWLNSPDASRAQQVSAIISNINPKAGNYASVETFRKQVASKLQADAKREWAFQMKQYEDNQAFKRSIVSACRDVGVAFGKGQPRTIVRNIVRGWW